MQSILTTLAVNAAVFSALFGVMLLARRLLAKRISAALQYALWAVVVLKLIIPFGFESDLSPFEWMAESQSAAAVEQAQADESASGQRISGYERPVQAAVDTSLAQAPKTPSMALSQPNTAAQLPAGAVGKPAEMDWAAAVLALWAAGAITAGARLLLDTRRLRRAIRSGRAAPPARVMRMSEACRRELGMRRRVDVVMQPVLRVPLAMGAIRPVLSLPEDIGTRSDAQLRHICLHELTHIKRGDLAVMALMNGLCAVYWFNPLVWLCFTLMRKDMETACDCAVLEKLGARARQSYIGTVLQFAGRERAQRLYAAMGMADGRQSMEERIRGMFSRTRTHAKGRLAAACVAMLLLAASVLTACQPTPEKPIVQSKTGDTVQQAIAGNAPDASAVIHRYSAPETWQSAVSDEAKKISINVDAQVIVPTDTWGIYQLVPQGGDKTHLERILNTLVGTADIYGEDTYASREELEEQLLRIDAEIAMLKQQDGQAQAVSDEEKEKMGAYDKGNVLTGLEERKQGIQTALQAAPDEPTTKRQGIDLDMLFDLSAVPADMPDPQALGHYSMPSVTVHKEYGLVEINGYADTGKKEPAQVYIFGRNGQLMNVTVRNAGAGNLGGFTIKEPLPSEPLFGVTISQDEAAKIARQAVADMGFDYLDIAAVHAISIYDRSRMDGDMMPGCYAFTFNRSLGGVPATYAYWSGSMTEEEWTAYEDQYAVNWPAVEVVIGVDDSGVVLADIKAPKSDINTLAEGVALKGFEDIMEIFNRQAVIEGCFSDIGMQEMVVERAVNVDEIRLGYMPTIWKDHPDQIIFVPVWDFFGSETTTFDAGYKDKAGSDLYASLDEDCRRTFDLGEQAILTINALDGTILRRVPGPVG